MKVTVDSGEPLEDAIRVVGALYGVTLVVSDGSWEASKPTQQRRTEPKKRSVSTKRPTKARVADVSSAKSRTGAVGSADAPSIAEVRSWARHTGLAVSDRGRVPASVMTAYRDAHQ